MHPDNPTRGRLIVIDGCDGAGKTSLMVSLEHVIKSRDPDVLVVREPGGSLASEDIREILKSHDLPPLAAFHLMMAASIQLYDRVINPALALGRTVLCDRWTLSSAAAYQGQHLGVDYVLDQVLSLPRDLPSPDLAIWLDVSPEIATARMRKRGNEREDDFGSLAKCAAIYRRIASLGLMTRVNANRGFEFVESDCAALVHTLMMAPHAVRRDKLGLHSLGAYVIT